MRVLQYYEAHGVLQMIPWQWPLSNKQFRFLKYVHLSIFNFEIFPRIQQSFVRYYGQNLLLHDCLHRSRHRNNFTIFTDMDENILPVNVS